MKKGSLAAGLVTLLVACVAVADQGIPDKYPGSVLYDRPREVIQHSLKPAKHSRRLTGQLSGVHGIKTYGLFHEIIDPPVVSLRICPVTFIVIRKDDI